MIRGILLAGNESSLFSALCAEAGKRVEKYAVALIPYSYKQETMQNTQSDHQIGSERQFVLDWNPSSPVSAKTMVLSGINKMEQIDDAILVCVPPAYRKNAEEFSAEEIDWFIDCNIKGWFFLVRELTMVFTARKQGTLSLVLPELNAASGTSRRDLAESKFFAETKGRRFLSGEDAPDLTGPMATAAFRSFAQGILLSSLNAPYNALGFSSPEPGGEQAFAAYVFKIMEEEKRNSGRWHKYGKFGFFGR